MGCDIHIQIEKRVNGKWERVPWVDEFKRNYPETYGHLDGALDMPALFDNRNYDLFGVLADVRNGTWGEEHPPIASPRGWPDDMAAPQICDGEPEWLGDHSFSWVTLRELQEYPWDEPVKKRGWVSHEEAAKFRSDGVPPVSYSAGGSHGEYIDWTESRRVDVRNWPDAILPILATLGSPDDVRLVFGFDS